MRLRRRRRFFLPSLFPPSTSHNGRLRLKGRVDALTAGTTLSKQNFMGGPMVKVKAKVVAAAVFSYQEYTMLTSAVCVV